MTTKVFRKLVMTTKVKSYIRSDGVKVKSYNRKGGKHRQKYTSSQRRAFKKSQHSKSGRKSWRVRQKEKRPGLWSNFHAKRHREAKYRRKRK